MSWRPVFGPTLTRTWIPEGTVGHIVSRMRLEWVDEEDELTRWSRKAPDFYWRQGDTSPAISMQLLDGAGVAINGTGASVLFIMWAPGSATAKVSTAGAISAGGVASYTPTAGNLDTLGDYLAEWQVTFSGGAIETFPNNGWLKIRVSDDLAA